MDALEDLLRDELSPGYETVTSPRSTTPEASEQSYRTLRTNLLAVKDHPPVKTVLIRSAGRRAKTATAANLCRTGGVR
jgi:hypothetical protein